MKPTAIIALIAALAFSFSMTSCVEDLGEIDRTQANVLKKSDFRGAWYKLGVVTDMPASSGYGFVGYSNFAGKVLFDIQENWLVVYPTTEKVKDGDAKWHTHKIRNYWDEDKAESFVDVVVGNPIGVYPITSHFDIQRQYSATTGATGNVLEENSTDRVWFKRKYFRVDWMGNTHADPFSFGGGGTPFELKISSADHYVQEHETADPNRFHMQDGYFDYTKRFHGMPQSSGWCSTYSLAPGDCSGSVFEVRFSFKRVSPQSVNDFEIRDYHDNPDGDRFGYFLASRYTYDENFGLTYSGHDYKAQIWNLWQTSKTFEPATDEAGNEISCLTNFDCAKPLVCDQEQFLAPGKCAHGKRIEYTKRGLRPIIYHLSSGHPISHLPAAYKVADNWADVFRDTVSWLYFWEGKWAKDGIAGFDEGHSNFGQRYCDSNADCAGHALGHFDAKHNDVANSLFIATGDKSKSVYAVDDLNKRADWMKKLKEAELKKAGGTPFKVCKSYQDCADGWSCLLDDATAEKQCKPTASLDGRALVMLVNASVGDKKAAMTLGGKSFGPVGFTAGLVDAHAHMALIEKEDAGRQTLTVTAGSDKYTIANANIESNRVHFVVFYGGDRVGVVRSSQPAKGVRVFHGAGTAADSKVSSGPLAEAGVNGVRGRTDLVYGQASEFLYYTGGTAGAVLLAKGSRSDVNCSDIQGVSQCIGWGQHITDEDRADRVKIRAGLPAPFVLCTNQWSGGACSAADKGNPDALNDCRYWTKGLDGQDMNPCKEFVPEYNKLKIVGDIRYNYIYWVTNPHSGSPLGYGPSGSDPDTGQLVWGTAYIYGAPVVTYGQYGKDLVDLVNGDLPVDDLVNGKYIRQFLQSQSQTSHDKGIPGAAHHKHGGSAQATLPTSAEEAAKRATADISGWSKPVSQSALDEMHAHEHELMKLQDPKELSKLLLKEFPTFDAAAATARLKKIEGTAYETAMINDEMALVMSGGQVQPGDAIPPEMIGKISPLGWATPQPQVDDRYRMMRMGMENIYSASFVDTALVGLAKRLKCKDGQKPTDKLAGGADNIGPEACYKGGALLLALQTAIFRGVLEHEIGHTVGLRHNFSASADALNYFEPYYSIREKESVFCRSYSSPFGVITANDMCETILGETCVPLDCASDAECPQGYACGTADDGKARCLDTKKNELGTCHGDVDSAIKCEQDSSCGTGGFCKGKVCWEKVTCGGNEDCNDGETCKAGICLDAVSNAFRATQKFDSSNQELKKYMPRAAPTQKEIDNRRTEYQYSSIMDYGQKINADFEGLGKYDYAAIRYGYGRLADIFADTSFMRRQVDKVVKNSSSTHLSASWRMGTSGWEFAGAFRHPFEYLNNWMPPEYLSKRDSVPSFFVDAEQDNATKYGRSQHDRTMFQVPYKYCSDEYRGGSLGCYYFDTGAHMQEIVYHAAEQMREYYVFDAFKRERMWYGVGGNPGSYMSRILSRYLLPIGAAARYYAVYNNIMRVYSYFTFLDQHPMYMKALREASEASFRELSTMLSSPAPGAFKLSADGKRYENVSFEPGPTSTGKDLNIPLGVGKYPWTTFSTKAGYYYADHPAWIGSYWDKVAAIMTMTSSSASFLSDFVGEQLPIFRGTAIGFNTIYPKELSTILGGLAAGATDEIGMLVDDTDPNNKKLLMRDPFKPADVSRPRVEPSIMNLSLRLYAAWQAIANLPAGFDPSYTDSMAVWLKGSGVSHDFGCKLSANPDGTECDIIVQYAEFEDPFGHKTYVAPKVNYNVNYFSPTFYMLTQLNKLKQQWEQADGADKAQIAAKMKEELEVVDYFRLLYKVYGSIGL